MHVLTLTLSKRVTHGCVIEYLNLLNKDDKRREMRRITIRLTMPLTIRLTSHRISS